jgi:hypothetical protein
MASAQTQTIGHLRITRQVLTTRDAVTSGTAAQYVPAHDNQAVFPGQGVRTLRRSQAEINFNDRSVLRINERTDVVVQDTATLRRIQLNAGLVWVRVAKGVATQVETPSATAVARGTQFTVAALSDGSMILTVFEGEVSAQMNGKEIIVHPGEQIYIQKNGDIPAAPTKIPLTDLPEEMGGSLHGWWNDVAENAGLSVANNTTYFTDLRVNIGGEANQQLFAAGLAGNSDQTATSFYLSDAAQRQEFLSIAQSSLVAEFRNSGLSLSQYQSQYGSHSVASEFPTLSPTAAAFLSSIKVTDVNDFLQAALANGAAVNVPIGTRAYYQPGSLTGTPNYDLNLLDRTATSDSLLGIGAAAALLTNFAMGNKLTFSIPKVEISGFGYGADPTSFLAGRASVTGLVGKTRYNFESNALDILNSSPSINDKRYAKLASVAEVEQPIAEGLTLFAGRRRFYDGPVFQDQIQTQLIADRYSSAGFKLKSGEFGLESAYLYDANPAAEGAQKGALASASYRYNGGEFGAHYIYVPELTGKDGYTGSFAYPVLPNKLDLYGEAGRGPDKAILQTYGFSLPNFFQLTQTELYVEYGSHTGIGRAISVIAAREVSANLNLRAFANFSHYDSTGKDVTAGIATLIRFGN